jgi:hypothetical protein
LGQEGIVPQSLAQSAVSVLDHKWTEFDFPQSLSRSAAAAAVVNLTKMAFRFRFPLAAGWKEFHCLYVEIYYGYRSAASFLNYYWYC